MQSDYDRKTGDGTWLAKSTLLLLEAIKKAEAESLTEPQKTMRLSDGADRAGLRPENCQR